MHVKTRQKKGKMQNTTTFRRKPKKHAFAVDQESKMNSDSSHDELPLHVLTFAGGTKAYKVMSLLKRQPVKMETDTGAAVSLVLDVIYRKY